MDPGAKWAIGLLVGAFLLGAFVMWAMLSVQVSVR